MECHYIVFPKYSVQRPEQWTFCLYLSIFLIDAHVVQHFDKFLVDQIYPVRIRVLDDPLFCTQLSVYQQCSHISTSVTSFGIFHHLKKNILRHLVLVSSPAALKSCPFVRHFSCKFDDGSKFFFWNMAFSDPYGPISAANIDSLPVIPNPKSIMVVSFFDQLFKPCTFYKHSTPPNS